MAIEKQKQNETIQTTNTLQTTLYYTIHMNNWALSEKENTYFWHYTLGHNFRPARQAVTSSFTAAAEAAGVNTAATAAAAVAGSVNSSSSCSILQQHATTVSTCSDIKAQH